MWGIINHRELVDFEIAHWKVYVRGHVLRGHSVLATDVRKMLYPEATRRIEATRYK